MWFNKRSGFKSGKGIAKGFYPSVDCRGSFCPQTRCQFWTREKNTEGLVIVPSSAVGDQIIT